MVIGCRSDGGDKKIFFLSECNNQPKMNNNLESDGNIIMNDNSNTCTMHG